MVNIKKLLGKLPSPKEAWNRASQTMVNKDGSVIEIGKLETRTGTLEEVEKRFKRLRIVVDGNEFYGLKEKEDTRKEWRSYFRGARDNLNLTVRVDYKLEVIGLSDLVAQLLWIKKIELPGAYNRIVSIEYNPDQQV